MAEFKVIDGGKEGPKKPRPKPGTQADLADYFVNLYSDDFRYVIETKQMATMERSLLGACPQRGCSRTNSTNDLQ